MPHLLKGLAVKGDAKFFNDKGEILIMEKHIRYGFTSIGKTKKKRCPVKFSFINKNMMIKKISYIGTASWLL